MFSYLSCSIMVPSALGRPDLIVVRKERGKEGGREVRGQLELTPSSSSTAFTP